MNTRTLAAAPVLALLALTVLVACGGGGDDSASATTPDQFGQMTLRITDSPVTAAEHVVVQFTGVEIKPVGAGAEVFDFDAPRQIDLLALDGGGSEILLSEETLPAGEYEWIRLKVNAGRDASDSYVDLEDGSRHGLFIPSGNETGLKLVRGFTIGAGGTHDFTIDFDLRRSVLRPPGLDGPFLLKPTLRLVNNLEVGTIDGTVAATLIGEDCEPAVYLFAGADMVPDDIGSATPPLASTAVNLDESTGAYRFRLGFVPAGEHTVAFTCAADEDDAETDDAIEFSSPLNVTVTKGQTATVEFLAAPPSP